MNQYGHKHRFPSKCGLKPAKRISYNKRSLQYGAHVEREHTTNPALAKRIAEHHLAESPLYYRELAKMEKKLEIK